MAVRPCRMTACDSQKRAFRILSLCKFHCINISAARAAAFPNIHTDTLNRCDHRGRWRRRCSQPFHAEPTKQLVIFVLVGVTCGQKRIADKNRIGPGEDAWLSRPASQYYRYPSEMSQDGTSAGLRTPLNQRRISFGTFSTLRLRAKARVMASWIPAHR